MTILSLMQSPMAFCVENLQDYPKVQWFTRKNCRAQCIVTLVAKIYCSKRIQNKNQHRKRHMGQNPKPGFRKFFPTGIIQNVLHSSRIKLWQQERSATGQFITAVSQKLWRDLAPKVFIGPSQMGTLCLTTAKIPDYGGRGGKQMFGINHMFVQMT